MLFNYSTIRLNYLNTCRLISTPLSSGSVKEWGGITMTDLAVDQLWSGVVSLRQIWQWISYGVGWYHYDRFGSGSVMEWGGITDRFGSGSVMEWGGITDRFGSGSVMEWYHYDRFGSGSVMEWGGITMTDLAVDQLWSGVVSL